MKTANEMYKYCLDNKFDQNWDKETAIKHLRVIEQNLQIDENVLMCFVGKREIMNGKCAFAITNKHISWGQQLLTTQWHKEILFNTITTIGFSGGLFSSMIIFNATSEIDGVTCSVKNNTANKIYEKCKSTFEQAKVQSLRHTENSNVDELLKYKHLLDVGAITPDEYEQKKKQLLGL